MIANPPVEKTPAAQYHAGALGYLVHANGREQPITEEMVMLALARVQTDKLSLHGNQSGEPRDG